MMPEARIAAPVETHEAVRVARELYGLEVSAGRLPGEYDDNFHLTVRDGRAYVLKVMHPSREGSFLDLQCRALQHLAQRAPQLSLPRVCHTRDNQAFQTATLADGSIRLVLVPPYVSRQSLAAGRPPFGGGLGNPGPFPREIDAAVLGLFPPAA